MLIIEIGIRLWNAGLSLICDINFDGKVDMKDISIVAGAFGSFPGHPRWSPIADVNKDSRIDLRDIGMTAMNFGKTSP